MKPHRSSVVLVFGIVSLILTCLPLGIPAWVMGNRDLREMDQGLMDSAGRDSTNAGRICGIIGTVLFIIWVITMAFIAALGGFTYMGVKKFYEEMQRLNPPAEVIPAPAPAPAPY